MEEANRCPRCNSEDVVRIVYGMPSEEMVGEDLVGRMVLGGCMLWPRTPDHCCQSCGHEWRDVALPRP